MMKYLLCNEREITERETAESEIEEIAERVRRERERGRVRAWEERGVKRALPARNAAHRSRPKTYLIFMNQGSEIQCPRSKVQIRQSADAKELLEHIWQPRESTTYVYLKNELFHRSERWIKIKVATRLNCGLNIFYYRM